MPIYFIGTRPGRPVKIGWGSDAIKRLGELQVAHHATTLRILRLLDAPPEAEATLHLDLGPHRMRGEWFALTPDQLHADYGLPDLDLDDYREARKRKLIVSQDIIPAPPVALAIPVQAATDAQLLDLWMHGRPLNTARAYQHEARSLLTSIAKPIREITLADLQGFTDQHASLAPASLSRKLGAIKSLFTFAQRIGYIQMDPARAMRLPRLRNQLAERILEESEVVRMIALETAPRDRAVLRMLYLGGLRISELCDLKWRHTLKRGAGGQISVFGKGDKTRMVLLPASFWRELVTLRGDAGPEDPVFRSREGGGHLDTASAYRIVKRAAVRAGLPPNVSPHWLRHAHASHALDRGAPPHLVQATLGHADLKTTSRYSHAKPNESSSTFLVG